MLRLLGRLPTVCVCLALALGSASSAQAALPPFDQCAQITCVIEPQKARRGQIVSLIIHMKLAPGFHTYPTTQTDPNAASFKNDLRIPPTPEVIRVGPLQDPPFQSKADLSLQILDLHLYEGEVEWLQTLVVNPQATPGEKKVLITLPWVQACNDQGCLPWNPKEHPYEVRLTVTDESPLEVDKKYQADLDKGLQTLTKSPPKIVPDTPRDARKGPDPFNPEPEPVKAGGLLNYSSTENYEQVMDKLRGNIVGDVQRDSSQKNGLMAFILTGVFWGLVSLVTPCVFPMIPITVSFFLKQSERRQHRPVVLAAVYCATIVIVLSLGALLLLSTFRALSTKPAMNFALGGLFIFFALSLFGMYEIELPSGLARFTSAREGRGGIIGTIFMALTFTILSFACVAPFLGGFGGTAANSDLAWYEEALGALAFSATFAAPFFLLAIFPSLLKKLPKSGAWLNSVKVVMGFVELAAAFKFLRLGELFIHAPTLFTYDMVLGIWVALCLLCGLYLLNVFRLPHDTPIEHLGVGRMLFAASFLALGFYLAPALLKINAEGESQRPKGAVYEWVDSFLLPESAAVEGVADLKQTLDEVREANRHSKDKTLVFLDVTGKACTNCRYNESSVFTKPSVNRSLKKYKIVQLYTDQMPVEQYAPAVRDALNDESTRLTQDALVNQEFVNKTFGTFQLPLYVVLEPLPDDKIRVVGRWDEGKINDVEGFARFLEQSLRSVNQ
jgi:cytochrome c biogenesis protein CcdA